MILSNVILDEDFRHTMRFSRGAVTEFYGTTRDNSALLEQRARWIREEPERHTAISAGSESMLNEAIALAGAASGIDSEASSRLSEEKDSLVHCRDLGASWEPDFLLMKSTDGGPPKLLGGCVCFPSHWSLEEKIGKSIDAIHSPVPKLNADLGKQIDGFLNRIKPGISWERSNWGLAATSELNLHPAHEPPRLHGTAAASGVWLRIERQSLVALPASEGILFGIRLHIVPLLKVMQDAEAADRLHRALVTMPTEMARYKGLGECRETLIDLLKSASS